MPKVNHVKKAKKEIIKKLIMELEKIKLIELQAVGYGRNKNYDYIVEKYGKRVANMLALEFSGGFQSAINYLRNKLKE